MTEYTPEKVAELVAEARTRAAQYEGLTRENWNTMADALTAVSANRDEFRTAWNAYGFEIIRLEDERDRLHKAITEALDHDPLHGRSEGLHCGGMSPCIRGILRAALDKEGNDDE